MELLAIVIFLLGYLMIALEHPLKINKTATALLTGTLCWAVLALSTSDFLGVWIERGLIEASSQWPGFLNNALAHQLSSISGILFFLIGAMTIVELIDAHDGFQIITDNIRTRDVRALLWIVSWVTFFLSAVLDNLTTSIVMVSLIRSLIPYRDMRMFFAGIIVIAANAGGAWSPIGDVTTTMLWIGGQISSGAIIKSLFLPSVVCLMVPLLFLTFRMSGRVEGFEKHPAKSKEVKAGKTMLVVGIGALVFVPAFKTVTHLPPFLGILLGLGVMWVISEFINPELDESEKKKYSVAGALTRIDVPSVLFFFGILLAVGALETIHTLDHFAHTLDEHIGDTRIIISLIGVISAIIDNVPLVAASMGMYHLSDHPVDSMLWHYLAYCAGTGGSLLIVGSAAGVAVMGMEKIDFLWFLKRISALALMGYAAGAIAYLLLH
ncbi:MAG: sodium:proton antiporter NhaD [Cyclobacteriaceae bacterium]|nr:sodium:proton antiporter NhaD [Cyclobacteriaceae bacterium]